MAPRKALPRRPARGASPRAARPALPAAAPAGAKRNQWVQGERTTPRALGAVAKSHWLATPGGCGLGHGGRGHQGGQQTKTVLLGPARAGAGKGQCSGHTAPWSREPPNCAVQGAAHALPRPWGPSRCLDATQLLNLIVLASVLGALWRTHMERRDSPRKACGIGRS